jgi:glycosidase
MKTGAARPFLGLALVTAALLAPGCGPDAAGDDGDGGRARADGGAEGSAGGDAGGIAPDGGARDAGGTDGACVPVAACDHVFSYPAGSATTVEVRGDFAADGWQNGVPMTLGGGAFTASVQVTNGATVHYKYVVDGTQWVEDPANPNREPDGFGGHNSVVTVDCGGCTPTPTGTFDWRDGIMYFVLVDRFRDGDPSNNGTVAGVETEGNFQGGDLEGVLDAITEGYFTDLGVNTLWLSSPVDNPAVSGVGRDGHQYAGYHGYWPLDVNAMEEHAGSLALLQQVVTAAHDVGIKVVLDYVMNHVHQSSQVYADHPEWFWSLAESCVCGVGSCSWDDLPDRTRCWFEPYLPTFDFTNAAARAFSVDNAIKWILDSGVDGYRLDAVKHIETTWITDLRTRLAAEVETGGQVFYLIGETFAGDRNFIRQYVDPATRLNGQFDFPLRAEVVKTILKRQGSMADLGAFVASNDGFYGSGAVMGTFLGNHDLPRVIHLAEGSPLFGEWDDGKSRAWSNRPGLPTSREPFARVAVAYALLMTSPGVPLIYYGDEIGMPGAGDPDNRRLMTFAGLGADQQWLKSQVARLASIRAAHGALRRGTRTTLGTSSDVWVYEMVDGDDRVYVALNRGDAPAPATGLPAGSYRELVADVDATAPLTVPARTANILVRK